MLKQRTVYFREEDLAAWEAVENKAQWLHSKLTGLPQGTQEVGSYEKRIELSRNYSGNGSASIVHLEPETCKIHKIPLDDRGRCMQKGCKYS